VATHDNLVAIFEIMILCGAGDKRKRRGAMASSALETPRTVAGLNGKNARPKLAFAILVHRIPQSTTMHHRLQFFVVFSSVTSVLRCADEGLCSFADVHGAIVCPGCDGLKR
jgi:hypothetical protein